MARGANICHASPDATLSPAPSRRQRGFLTKPTHGNIIRLAPPLIITEDQLKEATGILRDAILAATKA